MKLHIPVICTHQVFSNTSEAMAMPPCPCPCIRTHHLPYMQGTTWMAVLAIINGLNGSDQQTAGKNVSHQIIYFDRRQSKKYSKPWAEYTR